MSVDQQVKVCILLIATRKYIQFVEPLVRKIDRWFMPNKEVAVMIFSDQYIVPATTERIQIVWTKIESLTWPYATLYRYKIFSRYSEYLRKFSHLYYTDVDMDIVSQIGDEFLVDGLLAVRHPGFYGLGGWGSNGVHPESTAFLPEEKRQKYFAGGVQGGSAECFLAMSKKLSDNIEEDLKKNIIAEHNDESHFNHFLANNTDVPVKELDAGYCMVQSEYLRKNWKIDHLRVKIIALDKDHKAMRE